MTDLLSYAALALLGLMLLGLAQLVLWALLVDACTWVWLRLRDRRVRR